MSEFKEIKRRIREIFERWEKIYADTPHDVAEYLRYTGTEYLDEIDEFIQKLKPKARYWLSGGCDDYAELVQFDGYAVFIEIGNDVFVGKIEDGKMDRKTALKLAHYLAEHDIER